MPPALLSPDVHSGEECVPVGFLPTELWQEIANRFSTEEWVRTCGSVCRAFHDLQPLKLDLTVNPGEKGHAKLRWTARHWEQADTLDFHFEYAQELDVTLFGDLSQTNGEAKEAAAATAVTVKVTPRSPMREDSKHVAAYLESSLRSFWRNLVFLEVKVQCIFTIPPLHKLRYLDISMATFDQFEGLLASICGLSQLRHLRLQCVEGTFEPQMFNVGCLSCLNTLVLDGIVPKAVEFPSVLKALKLTGNAATIEGVSWLDPQVPLRGLGLTLDSPLSDDLRSFLHDMRRFPLTTFRVKCTYEPIAAPVEDFCMGCSLAGATLLPHFKALESISVSTRGNVSIVIPAVSAIESIDLWADTLEIRIENWSGFAACMRTVDLYFNHIKGEGYKKLQTLRTSGDLQVEELEFRNQSGAIERRLFSARRSWKELLRRARAKSGGKSR